MKLLTTTLALAAVLPSTFAGFSFPKGFNIAAESHDGSCKTTGDWEKNFRKMKAIPGGFKDVRVYASSDCNTLERAVPAAKREGVKLLAGVWNHDDAHFEREKKALNQAIKKHGVDWLLAVSVGSEDLYRNESNPHRLAEQIYDVRGMVRQHKGAKKIKVGHVDTWNVYVLPKNVPVIKAADFLGVDEYPYFQSASIDNAKKVFYKSLGKVRKMVNKHHRGIPVWITEVGWPLDGPKMGKAVAGKKNARKFWKNVMCGLFKREATFVFSLRDYNIGNDPSFGVLDSNWQPFFNLQC